MEYQASALLTAVNRAASSGQPVNFSGIEIDDMASFSIAQLWNTARFRTFDDDIITKALRLTSGGRLRGYELRNIEVELFPLDDSYMGSKTQEVCIEFSPYGKITDFNFAIEQNQYMQIFREGTKVEDFDQRMQILHYLEQFRTAYNQKNIIFMDAVFSDDALIITGKVIKRVKSEVPLPPEIEYTRQSKAQYLANLKKCFDRNSYINVVFDDIKVLKHGSKPNYYGVTLTQHWNSSNYSDEGILFLVWDFSDEDAPKIHVRTWQPIETPSGEIFTLENFKI
ncbi:MAG: nuclear transport factor 2 family protein [Bacteroidales bacterium]|nr:nuclear transport factor 2 family protein [Bacteroidales bacterium]